MAKLSKMSTTTKVLLVAGLGVGVYFVVRSLKKPEAKPLPQVFPSGDPSGGGLPPADTGGPPQTKPRDAPQYNSELQGVEAPTVVAYHAQWAAGNLEDRLRQSLGSNITKGSIVNALTDWAYKEVYGNAAFPIPPNWSGTGWQAFALAWNRMRTQMAKLVSTTLDQQEGVS